jgi:5-formyltetrahydrofolate cyclo-ligase
MSTERLKIRQQMRQRRRMLTLQQQKLAAEHLYKVLSTHHLFLRSDRIALYLPNDGEIDPSLLMERAWQMKKEIYLPVLHPRKTNHLWFLQYSEGDKLVNNKFGIPEPVFHPDKIIRPWLLNLVLFPLVAFDTHGGRLGMGGGFYDRTFAFSHRNHGSHGPRMIGLAHECQKTDHHLPLEMWDVKLHAIASDKHLYWSHRQGN